MRLQKFAALSFALMSLALAGCGAAKPQPVSEDSYNYQGKNTTPGYVEGRDDDSVFTFGKTSKPKDGDGSGTGMAVNAYLWRGALDTLSFMPLSSADPFGGVIITDWYQPQASTNERFKATAYILGRQLRADGIRISLFRQVQQNGQWVDAPVNPSTTNEVENKVLARARELRAQSGS
jgi:hypothetical protein